MSSHALIETLAKLYPLAPNASFFVLLTPDLKNYTAYTKTEQGWLPAQDYYWEGELNLFIGEGTLCISMLYRDAQNYQKEREDFYVHGTFSHFDLCLILTVLTMGTLDGFIPHDLDMPSLQFFLGTPNFNDGIDHPWHTTPNLTLLTPSYQDMAATAWEAWKPLVLEKLETGYDETHALTILKDFQ